MRAPKVQHYVPQFYLQGFCGPSRRLWVWDKTVDRIFQSTPKNLACESDFYTLKRETWPLAQGNELETQLSAQESFAAEVLEKLLALVRELPSAKNIRISPATKEDFSRYIALQFLRTADARDTLSLLLPPKRSKQQLRDAHVDVLWDTQIVNEFTEYLRLGTWILAKNHSSKPLVTSDNPVCFRTYNNKKWLKSGVLGDGNYAVFPLAPTAILYIFPCHSHFSGLREKLGDSISHAEFTEQHANFDNHGQVFMSSRFVVGPTNNFANEREFYKSIRYVEM